MAFPCGFELTYTSRVPRQVTRPLYKFSLEYLAMQRVIWAVVTYIVGWYIIGTVAITIAIYASPAALEAVLESSGDVSVVWSVRTGR